MAFRQDSNRDLRPYADTFARDRRDTPLVTNKGNAARAKVLASKFQAGDGPGDPGPTPPPFAPDRPFTRERMANPHAFRQWGDLFRNSTAMGHDFGPPPPPSPDPRAAGPGIAAKPEEAA